VLAEEQTLTVLEEEVVMEELDVEEEEEVLEPQVEMDLEVMVVLLW